MCLAAVAGAQEEVVVEAVEDAGSASERHLDAEELRDLPTRSADQILRQMPGLHLSAHGGFGKGYQFYLRGFDAAHGGDIAILVEGIPINEVSNVHGAGYIDLFFLPRAVVRGATFTPGSWRTDVGSFGIAGSAELDVGRAWTGGELGLTAGTDASGGVDLVWRPDDAPEGTFAVAEVTGGRGVGESRSWLQARAGGGWQGQVGTTDVKLFALGYDGHFASPGLLRQDDLDSGFVDFHDAYPGSGGGHSSRVLGSVRLTGGGRDATWLAQAYGGWRRLRLDQDFTGYAGDPEHGDATRQRHETVQTGAFTRFTWLPARWADLRGGASLRLDLIDQSIEAIDREGVPFATPWSAQGLQTETGIWGEVDVHPAAWVHLVAGLRGDVYQAATRDGEVALAPAVSPRAHLALHPHDRVDVFAAYGRAHRPLDLQTLTGDDGHVLARSDGVELGIKISPTPFVTLRAAGFGTLVSDERLFDHVQGQYISQGPTRRLGVDAGVSLAPFDALRVDLDGTWTEGRFTQTGRPIPNAPRGLFRATTTLHRLPAGPAFVSAGLSAFLMTARYLPGGFVAAPTGSADLLVAADIARFRLQLQFDNVLGIRWKDNEYMYASHWNPATPPSSLPARHISAGTPFAARLTLGWRF